MFHELNVSPFATNVLDLIGKPLRTPSGDEVSVRREGLKFRIDVAGCRQIVTGDNLEASRFLNSLPVGEDLR